MAALEGHGDPVSAIRTLMEAGIANVPIRNGVLDEHTILIRVMLFDPDENPDPAAFGGTLPPDISQPIEDANISPFPGIDSLSMSALRPFVLVGPAHCRRGFAHIDDQRRPDVYILLSDTRGQ